MDVETEINSEIMLYITSSTMDKKCILEWHSPSGYYVAFHMGLITCDFTYLNFT